MNSKIALHCRIVSCLETELGHDDKPRFCSLYSQLRAVLPFVQRASNGPCDAPACAFGR